MQTKQMPMCRYRHLCLVCCKMIVKVRPRTADWHSMTVLKYILYLTKPYKIGDRIKWNRITVLVKIFNLPISVHDELNKNKEYLEDIIK